MKRMLRETDSPPPQESIKSDIFCDKEDIEQFETIFKNIQKANLIIHLKVSREINQEIAEFACGEIMQCDNINCKYDDIEIPLLLSEISDPTLYKKDDLLFDNNANGFFDDDSLFIYCNQCKNTGKHCKRCDSFAFGSQLNHSCYRCTTRICEYCGYKCDNPICKIKYCIGGDTTSFISGCGERFLSEMTCSICETEKKYCHECEDKYGDECAECKKIKRKKNKKKKIKKIKKNIIYHVCNKKKVCKKCESDPDDDKGRICDGCNIFICYDHCNKYGRFCSGVCDTFCCNDCMKKGELNDCHREECQEMVCKECQYKCENCWDFLMLNGVDDDDIETVLRNGNYSDYIDD